MVCVYVACTMHVPSIILMLITPVRSFRHWWLNACAAVLLWCSWLVIIKSGNEIQCGNARHELNCLLFYAACWLTCVGGASGWLQFKPQRKLLRTTNTAMNVKHTKNKYYMLLFSAFILWAEIMATTHDTDLSGFAFFRLFLIEFNFWGMTRHAT